MKASVVNIRLISRYSAGCYAFAVKGFCALFSAFKIRSGTQFQGCIDLSTLCTDKSHTYLPLPQVVCNVPDSGRHVTSVFQDLSLSLSLRRAGRREPWERGWKENVDFISALWKSQIMLLLALQSTGLQTDSKDFLRKEFLTTDVKKTSREERLNVLLNLSNLNTFTTAWNLILLSHFWSLCNSCGLDLTPTWTLHLQRYPFCVPTNLRDKWYWTSEYSRLFHIHKMRQ